MGNIQSKQSEKRKRQKLENKFSIKGNIINRWTKNKEIEGKSFRN